MIKSNTNNEPDDDNNTGKTFWLDITLNNKSLTIY